MKEPAPEIASDDQAPRGKKGGPPMLAATLILAVLAIILVAVGYARGGQHVQGLGIAWTLTWQVMPLLIAAFIVAGMVQVLLPAETLAKWVGEESGMRGILIGTVAGGFTPGGPYVTLPIAAGFLSAGASVATLVAFITAWSLWAVARLPMEVAILGWKITLIRLLCTFFFPPIAGLLAQALVKVIKV